MKVIVYEIPIDSIEDIVFSLSIAAANIRDSPGIFGTVRQLLHRRYQTCIAVGGLKYEHSL